MSKAADADSTDVDERVVRRLKADDQPTAVRVLRAVRGQPVAASGRDYQQTLYRCPDLVARFENDGATVFIRRQAARSAFQQATVRDDHVTVTDLGVVGAGMLLSSEAEVLPLEDVDVFENPDVDYRGQGFDGGAP
ncbi:hypothetical protein ACFPYI_01695 [Halomarina salina]|uniref:Uncharacterized protein n=1 Tax=Halomarina salina TaxID=1872699 RepID=A0ABD5RI96_9EURY|nr:hypothetical protein [Halomarina salina]